jgi:hypothetical protein
VQITHPGTVLPRTANNTPEQTTCDPAAPSPKPHSGMARVQEKAPYGSFAMPHMRASVRQVDPGELSYPPKKKGHNTGAKCEWEGHSPPSQSTINPHSQAVNSADQFTPGCLITTKSDHGRISQKLVQFGGTTEREPDRDTPPPAGQAGADRIRAVRLPPTGPTSGSLGPARPDHVLISTNTQGCHTTFRMHPFEVNLRRKFPGFRGLRWWSAAGPDSTHQIHNPFPPAALRAPLGRRPAF